MSNTNVAPPKSHRIGSVIAPSLPKEIARTAYPVPPGGAAPYICTSSNVSIYA
jgi:hypothetical protein